MNDTAAALNERQTVALRRWKLGHHAFHVLLISMNTELASTLAMSDQQRWDELTLSLRKLTVLYDAATASMKYAADFDPSDYEGLIRPSMSPPMLAPGFSGEQNSDHATMLTLLTQARRSIKTVLRSSPPDVPDHVHSAASRLWSAQSRNRRHHRLVCERFVPEGGSLLDAYFDNRTTGETEKGAI